MKKGTMTKLMIGLLILQAVGCVGLRTREEVNEMETSKQAQGQVSQLQKQKAEADNKVMVLQDELRQLNGRLDMLERKSVDQGAAGNGPSNTDVIEQMKIFEQQNASMRTKIEELEGKLANAQKAQTTAAVAAVEKSTPSKEKDKDSYDSAEDLFSKKEWKSAILSYQAYRDANPKGKNYSDATYKIGVSFQELKMKDEAKVFFEEVLQKFPKSPAARKAKFRLGQLK
ncbi:MAG: tetratricopeptide repeat protein [Bdellovibrionota bacterium]